MINRIINITPFWLHHAFISAKIVCLFALLPPEIAVAWSGAMFYAGREIRDWEKLHDWKASGFDHKGFWSPVAVAIIATIILV